MLRLTALPRRPVAAALAALTLALAGLVAVRHVDGHRAEAAQDRTHLAAEVQESLSGLHRDLEMVNMLIASAGDPGAKRVTDYLNARRKELAPVRWLGYVARPKDKARMLLGSAVMAPFDHRHDRALAALLFRASESAPAAGVPDTWRNEADLALVLPEPGADGRSRPALIALVDVDDLLRDAVHELPRTTAHFELTLDGTRLAHWPKARFHDGKAVHHVEPVLLGEARFALHFGEPDWSQVARELWHLPEAALLASVALLAAWLAGTRPAAAPAVPAPGSPAAPPAVDRRAFRIARLWQLGEITASLAHDLGQPLNIVRLTAEAALDALDRGRAEPERIRRSLKAGIDQTRRMQGMIDTLLAGTRKPMDRPEPVYPVEVVRRALKSVLPRLKAHSIRLVWHPDRATPRVAGHPARLEMAVTHALVNACEALMTAALQPGAPQGVLSVACRAEGDGVLIAIEDNGAGFPPALLASLDAPLPATGDKRCGIGLAIVLGVAAEMGGEVGILDRAPGTRLELRLPAAGRSVLVAEDEAEAARELADYLGQQGWRVHLAEGGIAALALFERARPDAVVTDLRMSKGDGWTLIGAVHARAPDVPIVAVSAAQGEEARRAVAAGAVLVLNKPVGLDEVARELDELVNDL